MTHKSSLSIIFISLCFLVQFVHCHPKLRTLSNGVMMFKRKGNTTTNSISDTNNAGGDDELKTLPFGWDTSGKYFTSVWDNKSKGTYTAKGDNEGKYEFKWQNIDDAIVGKGFKTGTKDRVFKYDGQFEVSGNGAYLALYGWSTGNQCVEYYVVDNWGQYPPCGSESKGKFESDGDTYTICTVSMQSPCVDGKGQNHVQYWSKRNTKRSSGTITFANHVSAWEKAGMNLGTLSSPQLLAVEAYAGSSGSATITISASGGGGGDGNNTDSSSSTTAGGGNGTNTSSPDSQESSSDKDTTSPTTQGGISSNDTNSTSTTTQGGSVDDSSTPSNGNSGDDDSSKDAIENGNNDVSPDASKDSNKDSNEASNDEPTDASQDYSGDESGKGSDDKSDDESDDYGKDDSSPDDKDDSSADDESDATPDGDSSSAAKPNTTDASPLKDADKGKPTVPNLCNTVSLKDDDKNAGINDHPSSNNNNNKTTTPGQ